MYDAQTMLVQGNGNTSFYGPWFPRGGNYGIFSLEVVALGVDGTPNLRVTLMEKNASDAGNGQDVSGVTFERASVGIASTDYSFDVEASGFQGFEELIRYRYELVITGGSGSATNWVTFRMLSPSWYDKV
jgi:hypothetical protein